jgi:tetratricopeptide (TPR) repeat protein
MKPGPLSGINAVLQQAARHLQSGDAQACRQACDEVLQLHPGLPAAHHLRGLAAAQLGDSTAAIADLRKVWPKDSRNTQAALWLGRLHRLTGDYPAALDPLRAAAQDAALEVDARYELARALTRLRNNSGAMAEYRRILELRPAHADAAANLAFLLERANQLEEAGKMAAQALHAAPGNFMAQLTQGTLERRNGSPAAAQLRFEKLLAQPSSSVSPAISPLNRSIVLNQLAQCLLEQQQFQPAFERQAQSNALLRQHHPMGEPMHDGPYGLHTLARLQQWFKDHPPAGWSPTPGPGGKFEGKPGGRIQAKPNPVFLVGFPRSGTTLLHQALAAHPEIEVLEELEFFDEVRRDWVDGPKLETLAGLGTSELQAARQQYLSALAAHRLQPGRPLVIDKLPLNLVYLFLIHRLFPEARILVLLRDPRDVCLSCFFQAFELQGAMPYFLDLQQTAGYYAAAMSLAQDSLAHISNPVHFQKYETLVTDFEPSMRKILGFLGLAWNDAILDYRQKARDRFIDTPSYQQVTRPLYAGSIGRWQPFSAQLEPVMGQLGPWVQKFGYADH